jgi:hypothetical protein
MVEGSSDKVPYNEVKGNNWLKDAVKKGSQEAIEYKTYWDIRFDKAPNLKNITKSLNTIIDKTKSSRACNTLAEINHAQSSSSLASEEANIKE